MVRLIVFDVDGVLTDGSLYYDGTGEALKAFNVRDGLALALLRSHGVLSGVLSGRSSTPLDRRIRDLGFDVAVTGSLEKLDAIEKISRDTGVPLDQIGFVGDDVVDLPLAGVVGRFYAPADAHPLVLAAADHVLTTKGGRGAGREAAEHLLTCDGMTLEAAYAPLIHSWKRFDATQ